MQRGIVTGGRSAAAADVQTSNKGRAMDKSELLRAREMLGFSLGSRRVDVRGWQVIANDAELVGSVDSLFVDMHTKSVRYLGVAVPRVGTVLVPVGTASRASDRPAVILSGLSSAQVRSAPRVPNRPVTRADENAALSAYGMATWRDVRASELYNGPNFEERRLFAEVVSID